MPAGTTTRPPPAALQAAIALRIASVESDLPSATAPKLVILKSRAGNFGGLMRARIAGTEFQPITRAFNRSVRCAVARPGNGKVSAPSSRVRATRRYIKRDIRVPLRFLTYSDPEIYERVDPRSDIQGSTRHRMLISLRQPALQCR